MHELGHNLGYRHSGSSESEYGDDTGFMGGKGVSWQEEVRMCFNAAKSFYSQWYYDRHLTVKPKVLGLAWNGHLVGIDDYVKDRITNDDDQVILRVAGNGETDLFMMFNRAKGINEDVVGFPNMVTIVSQADALSPSTLLAGLKSQNIFRKDNWAGTGFNLIIQDCGHKRDAVDFAKVRIYLYNGEEGIACHLPINIDKLGYSVVPIEKKCEDDDQHSFFVKVDAGSIVSQQCKWLANKQPARRRELCLERGNGLGGYGLAHEVCCETCSQALPITIPVPIEKRCEDEEHDRFFLKVDAGSIVSKQCKWLANKKPARLRKLCLERGYGLDGYGMAHEVCCETCAQF